MDSKYSSPRGPGNVSSGHPSAPQETVTPTNNYPTLSEDVPPSYAQAQQQPFMNQPLPQPYQNQPFPQQQPFIQQQPIHQQQFPQPQPYPYPQAPVQQINVLQLSLDKFPINTTCPACKSNIVTSVRMETSIVAHIIAGVLCVMCCCPCAVIPYCIDSCKSAIHSCPDCRAFIGRYDPQTNGHYSRVGRRNW